MLPSMVGARKTANISYQPGRLPTSQRVSSGPRMHSVLYQLELRLWRLDHHFRALLAAGTSWWLASGLRVLVSTFERLRGDYMVTWFLVDLNLPVCAA